MACRHRGKYTNLLTPMMAGLGAAWAQGHLPEPPFAQQAGRSSEGQAELETITQRAEREAAAETEVELTIGSHFVTGIDSGPESGLELRCESDLEPRFEHEKRTGSGHELCWAVQVAMVQQQCWQLGWGGVEGSSGRMSACS